MPALEVLCEAHAREGALAEHAQELVARADLFCVLCWEEEGGASSAAGASASASAVWALFVRLARRDASRGGARSAQSLERRGPACEVDACRVPFNPPLFWRGARAERRRGVPERPPQSLLFRARNLAPAQDRTHRPSLSVDIVDTGLGRRHDLVAPDAGHRGFRRRGEEVSLVALRFPRASQVRPRAAAVGWAIITMVSSARERRVCCCCGIGTGLWGGRVRGRRRRRRKSARVVGERDDDGSRRRASCPATPAR